MSKYASKYTKEQKDAYFKKLRERWNMSKKLSENDQVARALYIESKSGISYTSFYFVLLDMRNQGLDGLPYIDCKTYDGWLDAGFQVKKGQTVKIHGIAWKGIKTKENGKTEMVNSKDDDDIDYMFPKMYNLFHRSQVEPIEAKNLVSENPPASKVIVSETFTDIDAPIIEEVAKVEVTREDAPEYGKQYSLTAIAEGKSWKEAEVKTV